MSVPFSPSWTETWVPPEPNFELNFQFARAIFELNFQFAPRFLN